MRISDWSSDVCSSDLDDARKGAAVDRDMRFVKAQQFGIEPLDRAIGKTARCAQPLLEQMPRPPSDHRPHRRLGERRALPQRESKIGRASGRARVCQYGAISGVAVSLKKKKNKHQHETKAYT